MPSPKPHDPRFARRTALVGAVGAALAAAELGSAGGATAAPTSGGPAGGIRAIPDGYAACDPRTARRVPLTQSLRADVPLYPGDPTFTWEAAVDTRTPAHDDGGYLLEQITSLGKIGRAHV